MVYRLKYLDSHTSSSLSSYGSEWTRIGGYLFDTTCWMVRMRMRNFMCFSVSGPFERRQIWRESDERDEGSSESPSLLTESQSNANFDEVMMTTLM